MEIHNYMEDVVNDVLAEIIRERKDVEELCKNEPSKFDIVALTLNHLLPKYIVTDKGRIYTKLQELVLQSRADVIRELTKAIEKVKGNPRY